MPGLSRQALEEAQWVVLPQQGLLPWQRVGRAALALGDPLGPESRHPEVLHAFLNQARGLGLHPVLAPLSLAFGAVCREQGLKTQTLGREGELDLSAFSLRGNRRKSLRQTVSRGRRAGLRGAVWRPPTAPHRVSALERVSTRWLQERPLGEIRIGLGWFDPRRIARHPVAVCLDSRNRVTAFATWHGEAPIAGLDLLRRDPASSPGAVEVMLTGLFVQLQQAGFTRVNLGLAPLTQSGLTALALRRLGNRLGYDCRGLERFKDKFRPRWRERFVAYASWRGPAGILAAGIRGGGR